MPYYRPIKTIASVGGTRGSGGSGGGAIVIISDSEPIVRGDGSTLKSGDFWYAPTDEDFYLYVDDTTGWERVGGHLDTEKLDLKNPTTTKLARYTYPPDYPTTVDLSNQSDANGFFVESDQYLIDRLAQAEANIGAPAVFDYVGKSPITTKKETNKVTIGFDMTNLPSMIP